MDITIDINGVDGEEFVVENPQAFDKLVRGYGLNIEMSDEQAFQLFRALRSYYEDDDA